MKSRFAALGLLLVAYVLFLAYDWYERFFNYFPIVARITNATTLCYLTKGLKRRTVTKEGPCELMRELANSHPEYKDFTVHESAHLAYAYDLGGKTYIGKAVSSQDAKKRNLAIGDALEVLVSKTDPATSRLK